MTTKTNIILHKQVSFRSPPVHRRLFQPHRMSSQVRLVIETLGEEPRRPPQDIRIVRSAYTLIDSSWDKARSVFSRPQFDECVRPLQDCVPQILTPRPIARSHPRGALCRRNRAIATLLRSWTRRGSKGQHRQPLRELAVVTVASD